MNHPQSLYRYSGGGTLQKLIIVFDLGVGVTFPKRFVAVISPMQNNPLLPPRTTFLAVLSGRIRLSGDKKICINFNLMKYSGVNYEDRKVHRLVIPTISRAKNKQLGELQVEVENEQVIQIGLKTASVYFNQILIYSVAPQSEQIVFGE